VKAKRSRIILFAIILSVTIAVTSIGASATEFTVHSGESIQDAVSNSRSGDAIIVEPGIYKEQISTYTDDLAIMSQSGVPDDTIIEGSGFSIWASNITVKGFALKGNGSESGIALFDREGECRIENNKILDYASGIDVPVGSTFNIINSNKISNCQNGITFRGGNGNIIRNNRVSNCQSGITYMEGFENTINNNEISSCGDGINLGNGDAASSEIGTHVENNIITKNDVGISVGGIEGRNVIAGNTISSNKNGYEDYTTGGNSIYNNYFNNTVNVNMQGNQKAQNTWNTNRATGKNIIGGSNIGGNYWATPQENGFSQIHLDVDGDGISEKSYSLNGVNFDYLPLAFPAQNPIPLLPEANFSANSTQGPAPLAVQFTDLSDDAVFWNWDFDNNRQSESSEKNPIYVYTVPGYYTVNLTVSNANGTSSKLDAIIVTVEDQNISGDNGSTDNSESDGSSSGGHSHRSGDGIIATNKSFEPTTSADIKEIPKISVSNGTNETETGIESGNKMNNESDTVNKGLETKKKQSQSIQGFEIGYGVVCLLCAFLYRKK
jgi:parallel beta-helix repeat protein